MLNHGQITPNTVTHPFMFWTNLIQILIAVGSLHGQHRFYTLFASGVAFCQRFYPYIVRKCSWFESHILVSGNLAPP